MTTNWMKALTESGLEIRSARDAVAVPGWLDTGNYALNWAISGRLLAGYPLGHTTEIFGDPSTGKSFLIARAIAMAQAKNGVALLDDTEGAYNLDWLSTLGVDVEHLAYDNSRTVKEHLELATAFIKAFAKLKKQGKVKGPGLLACDSLALLSTEHELEVRLEKRDLSKAAELKAFFRIIAADLHALDAVYISTNHTIASPGNRFNPRTTPGGGGPKFQSSVRLDMRSVSKIKTSDNQYTGVLCRTVVAKNRLAAPWKEVRLVIPFYQPISRASGLIPVLLDLGILECVGQMLRYKGQKLKLRAFRGKKGALRQDEEAEKLLDQVPELLEEADAYIAAMPKGPSSQRPILDEDEDDGEDTE